MKSAQKIAIGLASVVVVGGLTMLGLRKKKENLNNNQSDTTNGLENPHQTPLQSLESNQSQFNSGNNINPTTNQNIPNNVNYHQKGTRNK